MDLSDCRVATIVLAGGQGTRLYPLTLNHSKPAVSYGGRYRLIDIPISNAINSDFRQIFVIAQYLSPELQHHVSQTYQFDHFNPGSVDFLTPQVNEKGEKEWFSGTADAVRKTLPTLLKSRTDYFLILSGDQLYNIDFKEMLAFAIANDSDLTIACLPVPQKEAQRMGLLKIDRNWKIVDFIEKPEEKAVLKKFEIMKDMESSWHLDKKDEPFYLGSMGIYIFKRDALTKLLEEDDREDFGYHLIDTSVKKKKTFGFVHPGYWEDIGTVASYYEANLMLTHSNEGLNTYDEKNPIYSRPTFLPGPKIKSTLIEHSIICEGSLIEAKEISNCVIGLRSRIKTGTVIRDSVLMGNHYYMPPGHTGKTNTVDFEVGENCLIEKTIIDEHVQIGNNVQLINREKKMEYDGDGIFIRDGIIIVVAGTSIPDNFIL